MDGPVGDAESVAGAIFVAGEVLVQARCELGHGAGAGGVAVPVVLLDRILGEVVEFIGEVAVGAGVALDQEV